MKRKFIKRVLWILCVLGILGIALSIESFRELLKSQMGEQTWCAFGELASCEKAFQSEYSTLFGIPISLYGGATYFLVAAIALLGLGNKGPHLLSSLFHISLLGFVLVGATLYFSWALFFVVKTVCVLCLMDYTLNILITGLSWYAAWKIKLPYTALIRWDLRSLFYSTGNVIRTTVMVVLFIIFGFVAIHQYHNYYFRMANLNEIEENKVIRVRTPWADQFPNKGELDAPVHIVVFGDFECPYCQKMKKAFTRIEKKFPGKIRFTNISTPGNSDCNPMFFNNTNHPYSCKAAYLSLMIHEKFGNEQYWKVCEELYSKGEELTDELLREIGFRYGLAEEDLAGVWQLAKSPAGLYRHIQIAQLIGVNMLPTMLVNGIVIKGYLPDWALVRIIRSELKQPKTPSE